MRRASAKCIRHSCTCEVESETSSMQMPHLSLATQNSQEGLQLLSTPTFLELPSTLNPNSLRLRGLREYRLEGVRPFNCRLPTRRGGGEGKAGGALVIQESGKCLGYYERMYDPL